MRHKYYVQEDIGLNNMPTGNRTGKYNVQVAGSGKTSEEDFAYRGERDSHSSENNLPIQGTGITKQ